MTESNRTSNERLEVLRGVAYHDHGWSSETRDAVRWALAQIEGM